MKQYRAVILTRMFERKALSTSMHISPVMLRKSISPRAYSVALGRSSRNRTRCARYNATVSSETEYNKNRLRFGKRRTTKKWYSVKPRLDRPIACTLAAKRNETNARQQWSWSNENNEISVISCVCSASGFRSSSLSNDPPPVYSRTMINIAVETCVTLRRQFSTRHSMFTILDGICSWPFIVNAIRKTGRRDSCTKNMQFCGGIWTIGRTVSFVRLWLYF